MLTGKAIISIVFLSLVSTVYSYSAILENDYFRVEITEDWQGTHPPGSLLELYSYLPPTGDALEGMTSAGMVKAGEYYLSPGIFTTFSAAEGIFASPCIEKITGEILKARTTFYYRLTQSGLNISWRVDCDTLVTFEDGLDWSWALAPWESVGAFNQVGESENFEIPQLTDTLTRALRSAWWVRNDQRRLWFLQPDPLHSRWEISRDGIKQVWLHARKANTTLNATEFPRIASTLSPEHSIWGNLQLHVGQPEDEMPNDNLGWLFLSGMPYKAEQGLMMWWDEAPVVLDYFNPMTTSSNPSTPVGQYIVALLEEHPSMKNTMLLAMDKILSGYPFRPTLPGWDVPQSFVCIDTIENVEGMGALTISHYDDRATWVTQTVSCSCNETLSLSGWLRVDSLGSGWAGIYLVGDSTEIHPSEFTLTGVTDWVYREQEINTGPNSQIQICVGMEGISSKSRYDDLRLERQGINLLNNAGFNNFWFSVHFDGEGTEWWHAHSWMRIATEAPQDYLDWMDFMESGSTNYGWEDRMDFGLHCYHHTPNELYPLGGDFTHEFNFYDPEGDSARFYMTYRDLMDCGLTEKSFKTMRFAGHRHHLPAVRECVKYGVKFIDRGPDYQRNCLLGFLIFPEGVIWETNTGWWGDESYFVDPERITTVLSRGDLVLAGAHPNGTFGPEHPGHYELFSSTFTQVENDFPNLRYFFPEEFADFCEESRTWWDVEFVDTEYELMYNFYGSAHYGQTVVAILPDSCNYILNPMVDFVPTAYELRDNRLFIQLPNLDEGDHSVVVFKNTFVDPNTAYLPDEIHLGAPYPNPCNAWITFPMELPSATEVVYTITDVLGRKALSGTAKHAAGQRRLSLHLNDLPSGFYIYRLQAEDIVKVGKLTLLK